MRNYQENINQYREILKQVLLQVADTPEPEITKFANLFILKVYPKNTVIIAPNDSQLKGYFIVEGLVRMHYKRGDKEITEDFRDALSFFLNGFLYFAKQPNFDYFTALENTMCLEIEWTELEEILTKYHSLEHLGRRVLELHFAESMRVSYNTLFLSVDERYNIFIKEKYSLINRVPLKYIASYLGIKQETLSRLRTRNISK